jgi:hypothetical protein
VIVNIEEPIVATNLYKSFYTKLAQNILDKFIEEIDNRFHETNIGPLVAIYQNIVVNTVFDSTLNFAKEFELYKDEIDIEQLKIELKMWYNYKKTIKEFDVNNFDKLRQHFAENCTKEFPNIYIYIYIVYIAQNILVSANFKC